MKKSQFGEKDCFYTEEEFGAESGDGGDNRIFPLKAVLKIIFWFVLTGDFVFLFASVGCCGEDIIPLCFIIFLAVIAVSAAVLLRLTIFLDMAEDIRRIKNILERNEHDRKQ